MPTFTTIALENLLEPRVRDSQKKPFHGGDSDVTDPRNGGPRHLYISPALYATPEQSPIPDHSSPDPSSPSPYLVNLKRRRGGIEERTGVPESPSGNVADGVSLEGLGENFVNEDLVGDDDVVVAEGEGFLDPRTAGTDEEVGVEANDFGINQIESRSFASAQGEFFDAIDDFSSDNGSVSNIPSSGSRIESELHATRVSLLEEFNRRKAAEENLVLMRSQWERVRNLMNEAGLTFPAPPDSLQLENGLMDQLSQEVVVTRFVAEAIGRGQARAEAEEASTAIIELKDQEILRLRDRLQYFETVNHEMSQRKLVEVARRQQDRKMRRRRWIWGLMGLSVTIGASFVAYSYMPQPGGRPSLLNSAADSTDVSSVSSPETTSQQH